MLTVPTRDDKTGWQHFEDKDIKAHLLRKQIESLSEKHSAG